MALTTRTKGMLSAAMLAQISAGASAPVMMQQFVSEREDSSLTAYRDSRLIWHNSLSLIACDLAALLNHLVLNTRIRLTFFNLNYST